MIPKIGAFKPCRPAGPKFSSRTLRFSSKTDKFSTKTAKFLLGAATLSVHNTAPSSVGSTQQAPLLWWDYGTLLCSQQSTPLVGPQHRSLFATQHSPGRTIALFSVRNTELLWSDHSTLLCSQHRNPLVGLQHPSLLGVLQYFFLCQTRYSCKSNINNDHPGASHM